MKKKLLLTAASAIAVGVIIYFSPGSVRNTLASLLTLATAAATVAYAVFTKRLVDIQTNPNVKLYPVVRWFTMDLVIENTGFGVARDVQINYSGDLERFPDQMVIGAEFLRQGFSCLTPGTQYRALLANLARSVEGDWPSVTFSVTYRDDYNRRYEAEFPISLRELRGLGLPAEPAESVISKKLDAIARAIESIGQK